MNSRFLLATERSALRIPFPFPFWSCYWKHALRTYILRSRYIYFSCVIWRCFASMSAANQELGIRSPSLTSIHARIFSKEQRGIDFYSLISQLLILLFIRFPFLISLAIYVCNVMFNRPVFIVFRCIGGYNECHSKGKCEMVSPTGNWMTNRCDCALTPALSWSAGKRLVHAYSFNLIKLSVPHSILGVGISDSVRQLRKLISTSARHRASCRPE